jgi:hypothetical protein
MFKTLEAMKQKPFIDTSYSDGVRVEIYYENQKIYDAHNWNENFWSLVRPIMTKIPKGYNPFDIKNSF